MLDFMLNQQVLKVKIVFYGIWEAFKTHFPFIYISVCKQCALPWLNMLNVFYKGAAGTRATGPSV